ncbi:MAG TPA: LUD domain-containing protein [Candidatus Dormibacteraeota bacterium]
MSESRRHFRKRVQAALDDEHLQQAMVAAMTGLRERRSRAFESYDFQRGRQDLKRRRQENLERLDDLLDEFRERLEEVGGQFHLVADAAEARRVIGEISQSAGAGLVVKSKSMATEEIELNPYLESLGMEVVESDLGERMVQLTKTHPSHLIAPAIHLTKEDAARVFGTEVDIGAIQRHARESLRQKFIDAQVGISGANFAIAETGTLGIVTNEGNADLTTTLPPVHIAVFGVDKVVASLEDAVAILRMLPRSGTGQRMTSYVNWITGPSRSGDIEQSFMIGVHGPREVHCVVLDNGRSKMREDPVFKDALTCIRCGACSNACPPFMAVSGHQFGHIYNGPIGLVLTPFHHGLKADELPQSLCAQCNACQEICPVDIPLPRQILEHRRHSGKTLRKRALLDLWTHESAARAAFRVGAPFSSRLSSRPLRGMLPAQSGDPDAPPITIFSSCTVDRMDPQAGVALARILQRSGFRVVLPKSQWCCGLVAANAGDFDKGAQLSADLASALVRTEGRIVTPSTSCFAAFTIDALDWGADSADRRSVADRMTHATDFVLSLLQQRPDIVRRDGERPRVAYHDSCQSLRQLGLHDEPRGVLIACGYDVVDLPDIANCCGFGGTFSFDWPQVADRLLDWKLDALAKTGCTVLASDNPGCLVHIAAGARRRKLNLRVAHILELVAERLTPE